MPNVPIDKDSILMAYHEYADYDVVKDVERARLFRLACRRMLNPAVLEASRQNSSDIVQYNLDVIHKQLEEVEEWLEANDPDKQARYGVSRFDFTGLRG